MGVKVSNLALELETGSNDKLIAKWKFNYSTVTSSSGVIKAGDIVSITSGATYYNGVSIPSWVMDKQWYIAQVKGDRAVLGKSTDGANDIQSPINVKYLSNGGGSSSTVTDGTLDHFNIRWFYDTGAGIWFDAGESQINENPGSAYTTASYTIPENAISVIVWVTPVSKTHKVNDTDQSYWTGDLSLARHNVSADPPDDITSAPNVSIDKCTITSTVSNITDARTDKVRFEIYKDNTRIKTCDVVVKACEASYVCSVDPGGRYKVRCCAVNIEGYSNILSKEWSSFSNWLYSSPETPSGFTICKAESKTSVSLKWEGPSSGVTYEIEYTDESKYFDVSDQTTVKTNIETLNYIVTGLETGKEYFFRLRTVLNSDSNAKSGWSEISSTIIGSKPNAPTTWSSSTSVIVGEPLYLYWVHNSRDNSSQTYAELDLYEDGNHINPPNYSRSNEYVVGDYVTKDNKFYRCKENVAANTDWDPSKWDEVVTPPSIIIKNTTDEDEKDKISSYFIDTSDFTEGTKIYWSVRTAGITNELGDWSIQRTVDIYAPPTLTISVCKKDDSDNLVTSSTVTSFPFYLKGLAGPSTQAPIGFHVEIRANLPYETLDNTGTAKYVGVGDIVYSKYFDTTSNPLIVEFSPNNIDLKSGIEYTISCTVSMNSGLTSNDTTIFDVNWEAMLYDIETEFSIDKNNIVAYLRPYCFNTESPNSAPEATLSVYRRNADNSFTEIETGLDNKIRPVIIDPHPTLNYARYRIVAIDNSTGAVSFYDTPPYVVGEKTIVIQWDEEWTNFNTFNSDPMGDRPYSSSMLKLPYNIDVSEGNDIDTSFVEYIGRSHPVSYYGTQLGETSKWNTVIPKSDEETLYALRRLNKWLGDVYVREPSGLGYWASIKVTFSQKHNELSIPVAIDITRVEGGK